MTFDASLVNTRAGDQHIVHNSKDALTPHPPAIFGLDLTVVQHGGFVELYSSAVNGSGEGYLFRVEVLPAGPSNDLVRQVTQDVYDRVGYIEQASVEG